jgi:uncharacterized phage protein (predicted DNA packaging)
VIDYTTLEATKSALRIDHDDDDANLSLLITASTRMVASYLKAAAPDPEFLSEVSEEIQVATIMLVGYLYANPDSNPDKAFDPGYLPAPVQSILYPLRTPTLS